tara:strand:- start:1889 stop:3211 length:1323 start_codon:yes stop_codon:yes gene_type:complete
VNKILCGIRGMNDLLPSSSKLWSETEKRVKAVFEGYGYDEIRTPIVEHTDLFARGIGQVTDIVEKEMYSFVDHLNGDSLTLRPENTAAIARAVVEHNLIYSGPKKLWYYGPMFRHERPQRGRYRQFNQFGIEAFGFDGPEIEAEQLFLISRIWKVLGFDLLSMPRLEINCLGSRQERESYKSNLVDYFSGYFNDLDSDSKRRLKSNPLRILDSKNPNLGDMIMESPKMSSFLGANSKLHMDGLCELLDDFGLSYKINLNMVRGLDYYNLTVFEWKHDSLGSQSTICGGGRYDGLVEMIGGKPTPAFGFAIGMERLIDIIKQQDNLETSSVLDLYVVHLGEKSKKKSIVFAEEIRNSGLQVKVDVSNSNIKTQMKRAGASGAAFVAIFGDSELELGCVTVRPLSLDLNDNKLLQKSVPLETVAEFLLDSVKNIERNKCEKI